MIISNAPLVPGFRIFRPVIQFGQPEFFMQTQAPAKRCEVAAASRKAVWSIFNDADQPIQRRTGQKLLQNVLPKIIAGTCIRLITRKQNRS